MRSEPSRAQRLATVSNPLRDPLDRRLTRIAGPSSLVLFGVTGDLARKKLLPAMYDLAGRGLSALLDPQATALREDLESTSGHRADDHQEARP